MANMIISGYIDKNYDGWATINENAFADFMYEFSEDNHIGLAFETDNDLGGKRTIIPNCNISMYFSNEPMEFEKAQEKFLKNYFSGEGIYEMEANYVGYSEWTIIGFELDKCQLGGHNLNDILLSNIGKYVNIVVVA